MNVVSISFVKSKTVLLEFVSTEIVLSVKFLIFSFIFLFLPFHSFVAFSLFYKKIFIKKNNVFFRDVFFSLFNIHFKTKFFIYQEVVQFFFIIVNIIINYFTVKKNTANNFFGFIFTR